MSEINYLVDSNTTQIKKRMAAAKERLRELVQWKLWHFNDSVIDLHPEFDSFEGARIITEAWHGKKPHLLLMELAESFVKSFENQKP